MFGFGMILGFFFCLGGIFGKENGIAAQTILFIIGSSFFFGCLCGMIGRRCVWCSRWWNRERQEVIETRIANEETQKLIPTGLEKTSQYISVYPTAQPFIVRPHQYGE